MIDDIEEHYRETEKIIHIYKEYEYVDKEEGAFDKTHILFLEDLKDRLQKITGENKLLNLKFNLLKSSVNGEFFPLLAFDILEDFKRDLENLMITAVISKVRMPIDNDEIT